MIYFVLVLFCLMAGVSVFLSFRLGRMTMMRDMWEETAEQYQEVLMTKAANEATAELLKTKSRGDA